MEYAANTSMIVVGFFEVYVVTYIYGKIQQKKTSMNIFLQGYNRFMNDVKMMLRKRAAQYYLFATWCIISPILMLVSLSIDKDPLNLHLFLKIIIFSKLITAKPLSNNESAGFEKYQFPDWSTIIGWFIFVGCIIPIPLVYVIKYIEEFRAIYFHNKVRRFAFEDYSSIDFFCRKILFKTMKLIIFLNQPI